MALKIYLPTNKGGFELYEVKQKQNEIRLGYEKEQEDKAKNLDYKKLNNSNNGIHK